MSVAQESYPLSKKLRAYLTIMKPRVVSLLVASALTGYMVALVTLEETTINWLHVLVLLFTGFLTSGGANAINSWYDRDIDKIMYRTKKRPIPEKVIPEWSAILYAIICISLGSILAAIILTPLSGLLMLIGAIWYAVGYTMILKRRTRWNIIWGGIAGTFPVFAGWAAADASFSSPFPWVLGFIVWIWIPLHFWALAIRFRKEYEEVNVPMLPVVIGVKKTIPYIGVSAIILTASVIFMLILPQTWLISIVLSIVLCIWLLSQSIRTLRDPSEANSWTLFKRSNVFLLLIEFFVIIDAILLVYLDLFEVGIPILR